MSEKERWKGPDAEYIVPLYRLLISNVDDSRVMDWMAMNGLRYSNQLVKRTLRMASRADLIKHLIDEEEISIGDSVKSRMTARVGEVTLIRPDGDTIRVKWDTGGSQLISKESVFKLRGREISDLKDMAKVTTSTDEAYSVIDKELGNK